MDHIALLALHVDWPPADSVPCPPCDGRGHFKVSGRIEEARSIDGYVTAFVAMMGSYVDCDVCKGRGWLTEAEVEEKRPK